MRSPGHREVKCSLHTHSKAIFWGGGVEWGGGILSLMKMHIVKLAFEYNKIFLTSLLCDIIHIPTRIFEKTLNI